MPNKHCDGEGILCDKCMEYGTFLLGCCRKQCGEHFYCAFCDKRELYAPDKVEYKK